MTTQGFSIDLRIADPRWTGALHEFEDLAGRVLDHGASVIQAGGEVSILMTDDAEMQALNRQWRQLDKPTDVLSFPADGPEIAGQPRRLGDIAIGFETAFRDAQAMNRPFEAHIAHLLIHGFLHLVGYDHIDPEDAMVMEPLETKILAGLGWPDPYAAGPYAGGEVGG